MVQVTVRANSRQTEQKWQTQARTHQIPRNKGLASESDGKGRKRVDTVGEMTV